MIAAAESSAGDEAAAAIREAEEASAKKIQAMERGRQKRAELKAKADAQVRLTFPSIFVNVRQFSLNSAHFCSSFAQLSLNSAHFCSRFVSIFARIPQRRAMNERLDAADAKLANVSFRLLCLFFATFFTKPAGFSLTTAAICL